MELIVYEKNVKCDVYTNLSDIEKHLSRKDVLLWLDIERPTDDDTKLLENKFHFHPLAIEDLIVPLQRPKIDKYNGYLFIVQHAATLAAHKDKASSLELDCFLGENFLITVHMLPMKSVFQTRERCLKNPASLFNNPAQLFYHITDALVDNYFPILEKLDNEIGKISNLVFKSHALENVNKILLLENTVLTLRRFIGPQREVINFAARGEYQPLIPLELAPYYRNINDVMSRISDSLDSYREMLTSLLTGYTFVSSNRLSEIMKVLTTITVIMMPLTLIASFYGMNFKVIPLLNWEYGYLATLIFMALISISMMVYFKHKKWL